MLEEFSLNTENAPVELRSTPRTLADLDLEGELVNQYHSAKTFLESIENDSSVPPNQVAQVMNTCTAILKEIVKAQAEMYSTERAKRLEAEVVAAMKLAPVEAQVAFFNAYAEIVK